MDNYLKKFLNDDYTVKEEYSLAGDLNATKISIEEFKTILSKLKIGPRTYFITDFYIFKDFGIPTIRYLQPTWDEEDTRNHPMLHLPSISCIDSEKFECLIESSEFQTILHNRETEVGGDEFNKEIYNKLPPVGKLFVDIHWPNH